MKFLTIVMAIVSVLAFSVATAASSDADETGMEYTFILINTVDGEDSSVNGTYSATGTTVVSAFCAALDNSKIPYSGFKSTDSSIFFGNNATISNWTSSWGSDGNYYGNQWAIWNYSAEKGWFLGNTFGTDSDTTYIISHETYLDVNGNVAKGMGISKDGTEYTAIKGWDVSNAQYGYAQKAPKDLSATPDKVVFGPQFVASVEDSGITYYFESLSEAVSSTYGATVKVIADTEVTSAITSKAKNIEVCSGTTVTLSKGLTVNSGYTLTVDADATVKSSASGAVLNGKGGIVNNGIISTQKSNVLYSSLTGNPVTVVSYYGVDDTTTFASGSGTVTHNTSSDTSKYNDGTKTTVTFTVTAVSPSESSWDSYGTVSVSGLDFGTNADVVYIPSYIVSKVCIGTSSDAVLCYYKVTGITDDAKTALDAKTITVILPQSLREVQFGTSVTVQTESSFTDADGNKIHYSVDETAPAWFNGYTMYTMYTKATDPDARYCEQGTVLYVEMAERATGYSVNTIKWATNPCASYDDVVSGSWADEIVTVMVTNVTYHYTFILNNSVAGQDSTVNGSYTMVANTAVRALAEALNVAGVKNTVDASAASMWFKTGSISDWASEWKSADADCFGANYAVWNYSAEKGWFTGNTFGTDPETTYYISHENYYVPGGKTALSMGVSADSELVYYAPAGLTVPYSMYVQTAPRDASATPDKVVFGPDSDALKTYTIILKNSVAGQDSTINGTYTGIGTNPVQGLKYALNVAGITNTVDYTAASVWFKTGSISDWASEWKSADADCFGANYAVWNYSAEKGWFLGDTFGKDPETTYVISHENYYVPSGAYAKAMGVKDNGDGTFSAPAGLSVTYNYYVQIAPMNLSATPEKLSWQPYFFVTFMNGESTYDLKAYKEGASVTAPANPSKSGYSFVSWSNTVPAKMPAQSLVFEAVYATVSNFSMEIDLTKGDSFIMPSTDKKVVVDMNGGKVSVTDTSKLSGKTITSSVKSVENPSTIEGTAYELTFEANGTAYNGKMTVTINMDTQGKIPSVHYVLGKESVKMNVVSYTDDTVTFETDHNSTYVVSLEVEDKSISDTTKIAVVLLAVLVIVLVGYAAFTGIRRRNVKE